MMLGAFGYRRGHGEFINFPRLVFVSGGDCRSARNIPKEIDDFLRQAARRRRLRTIIFATILWALLGTAGARSRRVSLTTCLKSLRLHFPATHLDNAAFGLLTVDLSTACLHIFERVLEWL
jgi:hypothetical protein